MQRAGTRSSASSHYPPHSTHPEPRLAPARWIDQISTCPGRVGVDRVGRNAGDDAVHRSVLGIDRVRPGSGVDDVVARTTVDRVVARAAVQDVLAGTTVDG